MAMDAAAAALCAQAEPVNATIPSEIQKKSEVIRQSIAVILRDLDLHPRVMASWNTILRKKFSMATTPTIPYLENMRER